VRVVGGVAAVAEQHILVLVRAIAYFALRTCARSRCPPLIGRRGVTPAEYANRCTERAAVNAYRASRRISAGHDTARVRTALPPTTETLSGLPEGAMGARDPHVP
jgi:hypothetical protein